MEYQSNQFDNTVQKVEDLNIKQDSSILIVGQRRSGKTVLAIDLLYYLTQKYDYHSIVLFSDTVAIETNGSFQFLNKSLIFESKQIDEIIPKLMNYQAKLKMKKQKIYMIILLDGINLNKKSKLLDDLQVMKLVQYSQIVITNIIRSKIDVMFMSKQNNSGLESLYECINTELDKQEFYKFVKENTANNQYVYYNLHDGDNKLKVVKAEYIQVKNKKQMLKLKL